MKNSNANRNTKGRNNIILLLIITLTGLTATVLLVTGCAREGAAKQASKLSIALTFDDGSSAKTEELLQVLRDADVKAAFFLIGRNIQADTDKAALIFADGREIGNHSAGYAGLGSADESTILGIETAGGCFAPSATLIADG